MNLLRRWIAIILLMIGCGGFSVAAAEPNVLLIVSEDNGPELGCYGDASARTPHLDRLAADGIRFENAFVPYSVCSPSRASFLTGLYPHQNGQIGLATHHFALYDPATPHMASYLKSAGYRVGLIGKLHVNPETSFSFDFRAIPRANFDRKIDIREYASAAEQFLASAAAEPFFLSVNFSEAHLPFVHQAHGRPAKPLHAEEVKPMPWVGVDSPRLRQQVADYYNCLARLDDGVGLLLEALDRSGRSDETLVIYLGDHGAQFPRGKGTVYEGGLRIPLIVRWPGKVPPSSTCTELVSTVDLLPTILLAAGMEESAKKLPGLPLQPLFHEGASIGVRWREYLYAMTTGAYPGGCFVQHSIRDRRYKLISNPQPGTANRIAQTYLDPTHPQAVVSGATIDEQATALPHVRQAWHRWLSPPRFELYDLEQDPHEWSNLADDPAYLPIRTRLSQALEAWQKDTRDPFVDPANVALYVEEQLSHLDMAYRQQKNFQWRFAKIFEEWREKN